MKRTASLVFTTLALTLGACGDSDDDRKVVDLTPAEATAICQELAQDLPERTINCGGGITVTVGVDPADCAMPTSLPPTCPVTVGQVRACEEAQAAQTDAQVCAFDLPAACAPLFACAE